MSRNMSDDEVSDYGFRWGDVDVTRVSQFAKRRWLAVEADTSRLQIGVSATGRLTVYDNDGARLRLERKRRKAR